ncbi:uncharacterized protein PRCAT00003715001 [Priceomyces carsonii]|uniref:uncharacterized protein n=1 Tax=Priceomyces carsonii TaxID=28549 RepID=UPI002EDB17D0|nr:unnamed protein product [Priceomyces carsonii]
MGLFIPQDKFENLKLYKYSAEDHSIISKHVLKKWWNKFVQVFPMSMAPNVITLLGLMFIVVNLLSVFYYDPYLSDSSPRWCYFFYAFGLFMYQTFDGCDGCHARRTKQSGPLGELFDHSIDAINTTFGTLVFASVFRTGYGTLLILAQFASVCNFYMSTWEEYHTKTLYLSEFSGPVEGILLLTSIYILTGILGPDIWHVKIFELDLSSLGFDEAFEVNSSVFCMVAGLGALYFNIVGTMKNVKKHYEKQNKGNLAKANEISMVAYRGLIPFFAYYGSITLFLWFYPEVLSKHCFPLIISIGCTIAFSVGRIILAHLTLQKFPIIQVPMFLPLFQLFISKILISFYNYDEHKVLTAISWLGMGMTLGIHGVFVSEIIYEITDYLDIYALSIKYKKA